jgi:hypothetical protein
MPGLRIADGDWSTLTLEAFPAATAMETQRRVYTIGTAARTDLQMRSDGQGGVRFDISASTDGATRAWIARLHLDVGQRVITATVDGKALEAEALVHLQPMDAWGTAVSHFPFGGSGARPPLYAGSIAELRVASAVHARSIMVTIA